MKSHHSKPQIIVGALSFDLQVGITFLSVSGKLGKKIRLLGKFLVLDTGLKSKSKPSRVHTTVSMTKTAEHWLRSQAGHSCLGFSGTNTRLGPRISFFFSPRNWQFGAQPGWIFSTFPPPCNMPMPKKQDVARVPPVCSPSLLPPGNEEPIFKWRAPVLQTQGWTERLSWQTEREGMESSSLKRQGAADGRGDEELRNEK